MSMLPTQAVESPEAHIDLISTTSGSKAPHLVAQYLVGYDSDIDDGKGG